MKYKMIATSIADKEAKGKADDKTESDATAKTT